MAMADNAAVPDAAIDSGCYRLNLGAVTRGSQLLSKYKHGGRTGIRHVLVVLCNWGFVSACQCIVA